MSLGRWNPFRELEAMSDCLNRLMAWTEAWRSNGKEMIAVQIGPRPETSANPARSFTLRQNCPNK